MTEFLQIIASLREQMNATLSRSDVLRSLIWPMGILLLGTLGVAQLDGPFWLLMTFAVLFVLTAGLYLASFIFCLFNDRDALRSEKYSLQKLAIQQGLYGDSRIGLVEPGSDTAITATKSSGPPIVENGP